MQEIRLFTVAFDAPIEPWELPKFREAIIEKVGANTLYTGDTSTYPLIQYHRFRQQPQLVFVNEAVKEAQQFFVQPDWSLDLGERVYTSNLSELRAQQEKLGYSKDQMREYRLNHWIPFGLPQLARYEVLPTLLNRLQMLESELMHQLIDLAGQLKVSLQEEVKVHLVDWYSSRLVQTGIIEQPLLQLNLRFRTNLVLPIGLGLGPGATMGKGRISKYHRGKSPAKVVANG